MELFEFETVVIGAGVIGLAIAYKFASEGNDVLLLEQEEHFGTGISSRNSEVVHSGIYYPTDSLKARLCVAGKALLYDWCAKYDIAYRQTGKLIVATCKEEEQRILHYYRQGVKNGVHNLKLLNKKEIENLEPAITATSALYSPDTGIIDSHGFMHSLLQAFEQAGGTYVAQSPVLGGVVGYGSGHLLEIGGEKPCRVRASTVINSTGLHSQSLAHKFMGFPKNYIPEIYYAIGHYYSLSGPHPFRHLIYPVAAGGGLGIHLTLDLQNAARFGPDVRWQEKPDYTFDDSRRTSFLDAIRKYWPALPEDRILPGYTGIRPKLWGPGNPEQDFMIQGPEAHGIRNLVNLYGIESPGLTTSLALAEYVKEMV